MPAIISKIEGRGNGIKTVIPNLADIARALNRPPTYPLKYFGYELGAQTKVIPTKNAGAGADLDKFVLNGAQSAEKLQETLDGFIDKFVLCGECKNPETDFVFLGNGDIQKECKACGKKTLADMKHKLVSFILKNPPTTSNTTKSISSGKKQKKDDQAGEEDDDNDYDDEGGADDQEEEAVEEAVQTAVPVKSQLDDWSVAPTDVENIANGVNNLLSGAPGAANDDPLEKLANFITNGQPTIASKSITKTEKEIISKVSELGIRNDKAVAVLAQVMFDENIVKEKQMKKWSKLFTKLIETADDEEKAGKAFLGGLERFVGVVKPDLLSKIAVLLKDAYELEIVEEETILKWGEKPSKKFVDKSLSKEIHKKAAPFLEWLKNAEEESSEEDDE